MRPTWCSGTVSACVSATVVGAFPTWGYELFLFPRSGKKSRYGDFIIGFHWMSRY